MHLQDTLSDKEQEGLSGESWETREGRREGFGQDVTSSSGQAKQLQKLPKTVQHISLHANPIDFLLQRECKLHLMRGGWAMLAELSGPLCALLWSRRSLALVHTEGAFRSICYRQLSLTVSPDSSRG